MLHLAFPPIIVEWQEEMYQKLQYSYYDAVQFEVSPALPLGLLLDEDTGATNSRNPRHLDGIEGGRVYQAPHIDSKSVLDALRRVKKCFRRSMWSQKVF